MSTACIHLLPGTGYKLYHSNAIHLWFELVASSFFSGGFDVINPSGPRMICQRLFYYLSAATRSRLYSTCHHHHLPFESHNTLANITDLGVTVNFCGTNFVP